MDIQRPDLAEKRKKKRIRNGVLAAAAVLLVTLGLSRLKPAAPSVERATVLVDSVKRGDLLLQVRGLGTLVPVDIRWIAAQTNGRVERRLIEPGTMVKADSVILELTNPEADLAAQDADQQLRAAQAQLTELKVRLESGRLDQTATAARVEAEFTQAKLRADADSELAQQGLVPEITLKVSRSAAEELANRNRIEKERLRIGAEAIEAQLAVQRTVVEQRRATAVLRRSQVEALKVKAGLDGMLQQVPVEVGQQVTPGTNLARVAQPTRLKAVIRIAETQAKDVVIGQKCFVDTRNGIVNGQVSRVDPAVQQGTVTVDVALTGEMPKGARPDLTVDGTIELARLDNVLHVGRPAQGQGEGTVTLFRLDPASGEANRVKVRLGRASVQSVEVLEGLKEGDQVLLSDTSAWDGFDRIRLN